MSLKYEPSSEALHISAQQMFLDHGVGVQEGLARAPLLTPKYRQDGRSTSSG